LIASRATFAFNSALYRLRWTDIVFLLLTRLSIQLFYLIDWSSFLVPSLFYNKQTDILSLTRTGSGQSLSTAQQDQDLLQELEPHWQSYWTCYTAADLGRMVSRIIDSLGAFAVRQGGEAYNVPYQKRDELQVLKDLIELELPAAPGQTNASMPLSPPSTGQRPNSRCRSLLTGPL